MMHASSAGVRLRSSAFAQARRSSTSSGVAASRIAAEALLIWGRIDYAQQRYEEGDAHFVAGLAILEHLRLDEEISDQSALYAQLLDEREQLPQAIVYYKRAFESRRRIGAQNQLMIANALTGDPEP